MAALERTVGASSARPVSLSHERYTAQSLLHRLSTFNLPQFPDRIYRLLAQLNDGFSPQLDYELNCLEGIHAHREELTGQGYDIALLGGATVLTDVGKSCTTAGAKIYLAGEISPTFLEKPIREAIRTIGVELNTRDCEELQTWGYDPDTCPIGFFYTDGHIAFARVLFGKVLSHNSTLVNVAKVALSHHFSQGYNELGITAATKWGDISEDVHYMRRHAVEVELIDKAEALQTRRRLSPKEAEVIVRDITSRCLQQNYGDIAPRLIGEYDSRITMLSRIGLFETLGKKKVA